MARFSALSSDTSDDEEERQEVVPQLVQDIEEEEEESSAATTSEEEEQVEESEEEEDESSDDEGEPSTSIVPWAQHVRVDPQKMHVMQASLFRVPEESAVLRQLGKPSTGPVRLLPLNRKHSRDSDGDLRLDSRERASFAHDIDTVFRPSRKYARVESTRSAVAGNEGYLADAGLAVGRSFRVGWGPGGKLVHPGQLASLNSTISTSANSSTISKTAIPLCAATASATTLATTLLQHHLTHTPIHPDELGVPFADPVSTLRFSSFASLFPLSDTSHHASIFRLGHALFDEQDLKLGSAVPFDVKNRISALGRKAALSEWLTQVVAPTIEEEFKGKSTPASAAFVLLTGNQVEKACDTATDGGLFKLATLISQAGSADAEFCEDLKEQLRIWRDERVDAHIDADILSTYKLLSGTLDPAYVRKLDWKRAFALCLWFALSVDATVAQVYELYTSLVDEVVPPPTLHSTAHHDGLFSLIRLHADPATSLTQILHPLSFSSSPADYALPWHLYILLSRCMRVRDLADRQVVLTNGEEDERVDGHCPSADLMTSAYAQQLESLGLIQEATFVLLHIEGSVGRRKAIKDLLIRSAPKLDEWMCSGLLGSLKLPREWVDEAKGIYAYASGDIFTAYELYLSAGLWADAHDVAISHLAPEAIIRQDYELLKDLFAKIQGKSVPGWHTRGKALLDYANIVTRLPALYRSRAEVDAIQDASEATEMDELTRAIPKLIGILPDVLPDREDARQVAALAEMIGRLVHLADKIRPLTLTQSHVRSVKLVDNALQVRHVHATATARFMAKLAA